jgi:BirA family transcriptional regulator, biotin operon repressor / biotin---[acetyl-CoA-carboxylase] ligase
MTGFTKFTETDLPRIASETFVADVVHLPEVSSTNDLAMNKVTSGERPMPHLVLADRQTAGRGRGGSRWWSQPGGLTFSLILEMNPVALPKQRWPQISLAVGLAVCRAAELTTAR